MRYYYAITQVDEYGNIVCIGLIDTFSEITQEGYMRIDTYDETLREKCYINGKWVTDPNWDKKHPITPPIEA